MFYKVKKDFKALRNDFKENDIVVFDSMAYSHYDNMTGFFFKHCETGDVVVWDIHDKENIMIWKQYFKKTH